MGVFRSFALASVVSVAMVGTCSAAEYATGAAKQSIEQWFSKAYRKAVIERWQVFYAENDSYAVAVADYTAPNGGNGVNVAVGVFRKEPTGKFVFVKKAQPADGIFGDITGVMFKPNLIIVSSAVLKPEDPHCCPTGLKVWSVALP